MCTDNVYGKIGPLNIKQSGKGQLDWENLPPNTHTHNIYMPLSPTSCIVLRLSPSCVTRTALRLQ